MMSRAFYVKLIYAPLCSAELRQQRYSWVHLAGPLHIIRGMLCFDGTDASHEAELQTVARQPRPWHADASQADEG